MNNLYFNIGGVGNAGTFVNSEGRSFTSDEQTTILNRTVAAWYLTLVCGQACHIFQARTRYKVIHSYIEKLSNFYYYLIFRTVSLFAHGPFTNSMTNYGVLCAICISIIVVYVPGVNSITTCGTPDHQWIFNGVILNLVIQLTWTEWRKWFTRTHPDSYWSKFFAW
jgi:hypothetical protein